MKVNFGSKAETLEKLHNNICAGKTLSVFRFFENEKSDALFSVPHIFLLTISDMRIKTSRKRNCDLLFVNCLPCAKSYDWRIDLFKFMMRAGYLPTVIAPIERKRYISSINSRNTNGNLLGYYRYMLRVLKKPLDMYVKMFGKQEADSDDPLMTIAEFAKYCSVPKLAWLNRTILCCDITLLYCTAKLNATQNQKKC
jgi:hypothetical protein